MTVGPAGAEPRWLTSGEQVVWRDFLDVTRLLMERLNRQLVEDSGMTLAEYEVLVRVSEAPERRLRMSELADLVVNSRSRLTHTVRRLEDRGWVTREDCAEDRRGILCVLLDEGYAVLEAAAPGHVEAVRSIIFDPLSEADVDELGVIMAKVRSGLRSTNPSC
jgi:DNA-binding MarR family transcriptional regulator